MYSMCIHKETVLYQNNLHKMTTKRSFICHFRANHTRKFRQTNNKSPLQCFLSSFLFFIRATLNTINFLQTFTSSPLGCCNILLPDVLLFLQSILVYCNLCSISVRSNLLCHHAPLCVLIVCSFPS